MSKNGLPLGRLLTMGLSGLKHKPFRMVVSVILAVIAFTFFCFSIVSTTTDVMTAELKTVYKNDEKTVVMMANSIASSYTKYTDGMTSRHTSECTPVLTETQIEILADTKDYTTMKIVNSWNLPHAIGSYNRGGMSREECYNPYNNLSIKGFQRVVELNPKTGEADACLQPDSRLTVECHLPKNFNQIAITDYWADMYMRFGFVDNDGILHTITSPDDLIGRTIDGDFTICGIYSTDEDKSWLKQYDYNEYTYGYVTNDYIRNWLNGEHIMSYAFICEGYVAEKFPEETTYNVLYKLSGNISKDKKLIDKISYSYYTEWLPEENLGAYTRIDYSISATFRTAYAGLADATEFFRNKTFLTIAIIVSVCFAVFSGLLLMSFLSVNMDERKRELGILRALGACRWDVAKICMTESFFIACVDFLLSLLLTGIVCLVLNIKYNFWLFAIGIIPCISLTALCFGVAALSTIIPVIRITSQKPIDSINRY